MFPKLACLLLLLAPFAAPRAEDLVPLAIEAVLAEPDDPDFFGIQDLLLADEVWSRPESEGVRCLAVLPDVTGDGVADFAAGAGHVPGVSRPLRVHSGADGSVVWRAAAGEGFRSLRGLAVREGRLAAGASAPRGRVAVHAVGDGAVLWARELAPAVDTPVLVHTVRWIDDQDGDGVPELLVAVGHGRDAAFLLSGADGAELWVHEAGDVVYDAVPHADLDADGRVEIAVAGGDDTPTVALLDGATGAPRWSRPLDGPGSALLTVDDVDGDGAPELAVGQFNEPDPCLLLLDGAGGATLWASPSVSRGVTTLLLLDDLIGTGLKDIGVGSFDNAVTAVLTLNGVSQWRRETSSNNGGHTFSIADAGDLDGNGTGDVVGAAMDHQLWFVEGAFGQYLSRYYARARCRVVAALPDTTGDGRAELLLASADDLVLIDGRAGLAGGPVTEVHPPEKLSQEIFINQWTLPATQLYVFASLGTGSFQVPAYGEFGLDPTAFVTLQKSTAPGAGVAGLLIAPLPREASGLEIFLQSVSIYEPHVFGLVSEVESFVVP